MGFVTRERYHYCCDHSAARIGTTGALLVVKPINMLVEPEQVRPYPQSFFVWFTDLAVPARDVLGLSSEHLACDRTAHRYRAVNHDSIVPWTDVRRTVPESWRYALELTPGVKPRHWFVSSEPVVVEYDPLERAS